MFHAEVRLTPLGVALVLTGLVLWLTALVQLLIGFPRGKLVTSGAYGVCRNPIYYLLGRWALRPSRPVAGERDLGLFVVAAVFCLGFRIFIRKEAPSRGARRRQAG